MTKFIKVTEANDKSCELLINIAFIASIGKGYSGKDTHIKMCYTIDGKKEYYFVKESIEQIEEQLR